MADTNGPQPDFAGKVALVTGAASGIGKAVARWLDAAGVAELILIDLNRYALDDLGLSCTVRPYGGDVADPSLWTALGRDVARLDLAVFCAGVSSDGTIADTDFAQWRKHMAVNLDGSFLSLRFALRKMIAAQGGSIVLLGSAAGIKPVAGTATYGTAKAAMLHLARIAALEGAPHGIRVNVLAPGTVDTPMWDSTPFFRTSTAALGSRDAALAELGAAGSPLGSIARPEDIAGQVGFLLSGVAGSITGATLVADGGFSI